MKLCDFDYELPAGAIATHPAQPRDSARLLDLSGAGMVDRRICDLASLLRAGDLLVVNNTKVIPARLSGMRGAARIGVTLHKHEVDNIWRVFAKPAKKCKPDDVIVFANDFGARVIGRGDGGDVELAFINPVTGSDLDAAAIDAGLGAHGSMPLPPYIARPDGVDDADASDYQTMFASEKGAVAAPTAGLHFTDAVIADLADAGIDVVEVTLHVGAGTFLPVTVDDIAHHKMHSEWGRISTTTAARIAETKANGGRIIAIGTTSLRILEAAAQSNQDGAGIKAFSGETDIFITPGFRFHVVDMLLTNFHLPKSTLLMLVSAFSGMENIRAAYQHAIANGYRFFSYGDACLLAHRPAPELKK